MFLDIATGIFASFFVGYLYSFNVTFDFLFIGILFNLLPDIDAIIYLLKTKSQNTFYNHRDLIHKPLIFLLVGLGIYFYNQPYGLLFLITTFAHLIHDSIGVGWGVQWLWPFNATHYAFLYLYSPPRKKIPHKWIYSWNQDQLTAMVKEYGDDQWIKNIYFKLHPYAIIEYLFFTLAIGVLLIYFVRY